MVDSRKTSFLFYIGLLLFLFAYTPVINADDIPTTSLRSKIQIKGEASKYLNEIEIPSQERKLLSDETSITEASVCTIQIDLGLMDSIANLIILHPKENIHVDFVIEQQLETSVTVMDEGPHMDLVGWKHYVSEWEKIERLDSHSFISSYVSSNRFPDVTKSEIIEAVKEQASSWLDDGYDIVDRWVRLAQQCNNVHEYPCSVSISLIRLRIKVNVKGEWKEIYQIELNVPMGC